MRITMNQGEIESAIRHWLAGEGLDTEGKNIDIDLKATRGAEGYTADVNITTISAETTSTAAATPAVTPKPVPRARPALAAVVPTETSETVEAVDEAKAEPEAPVDEPVENTDEPSNKPTTEAETETAEVEVTAPPKSLFGKK